MPSLNITSEQFRTVTQNVQNKYVRLELLNYQYQIVDNLEGVATGGSISINANSDIRRTASITMVVKDSSFEVQPSGKIWLDKYVRIYSGVFSFATGEIEWTNCGIYIVDAPSYRYDAVTNTLTLSLLDLMAKLTGMRNGYLKGIPVVLKAGENIRKAIIDTLALGGFTKYVVEEAPSPSTIPNDLEFGQGATVYTLIKGLRDIYPNYECFFDVDGTFYYKPIPTGKNDPILVDDTLFEQIVISEDINVDFQNVKNSIEVYGRTHNPAHYSENTTVSGGTITLNIADVTEYKEDMIYGFTLKDNKGITAPSLKINSLTTYPVKMLDGTTNANIQAEEGDIYFCVQFKKTYWLWLGHLQAYGFAEDTNEKSPFNVNSTIGRIRLPLYGGEYDNCLSDELAQERSKYELWLHTNMNNSVQLNCVPVPWMDVNILCRYTSLRNKETNQYLIKTISFGLAPTDSMSLSMIKFYPEDTEIIKS